MVQVITPTQQHYRKPSFSQQISSGLEGAMPGLQQYIQEGRRQSAQKQAAQNLGIDPSIFSLPEQFQSEFAKQHFTPEKQFPPLNELQQAQAKYYSAKADELTKGKQPEPVTPNQQADIDYKKARTKEIKETPKRKAQENVKAIASAKDTLNRMKQLRKEGNLGIGSTWSPFPKTRQHAAEYERLGKSLIQYASNIPIRNKSEFETLASDLFDPTTTDATAAGILDAMERLLSNSEKEIDVKKHKSKKDLRPPLTSFMK